MLLCPNRNYLCMSAHKVDISMIDQVDNMQEQKGNGSRETELLKNEPKTSATHKINCNQDE